MHTVKRIALWSCAALLSIATAGVLFLAVAGDSFYHWAFRQTVEGATNRKVHVDGTFSFDLGWEPRLSVSNVWIENAAWTGKKEMARAEQIEIQVALKPLLSGILRLPRVVARGVDVELERSPDQRVNWDIGRTSDSRLEAAEDTLFPLVDSITLSDITVTYLDRGSGREIVLRMESLEQRHGGAGQEPAQVSGTGSLNRQTFRIDAQVGSIEDAIAALKPYPLDISLHSTNFTLLAKGTVDDLPGGRGLDISLNFDSPSLSAILRMLQIDAEGFGAAQAALRLKGGFAAPAAEEIAVSVTAPQGETFTAQGRIANLVRGDGVDLSFNGTLDPRPLALLTGASQSLQAITSGLTNLDVSGRLTGSYARLSLEAVDLRAAHVAGAQAGLRGRAAAGFTGSALALSDLAFTAELSLPDEKLLADALQERIPPMTQLSAKAELAWSGEWVELRSARVNGRALDDVVLTGKGKIGRLSGTGTNFDLDVDLELQGSSGSSRPLPYLFEGFSPSKWQAVAAPASPPAAAADLVLQIQRQLAAAGLDPGKADGKMGPRTRAAIESYQGSQGLTVDGRATAALLRHLLGEADAIPRLESLPEARPTFPLTETLPDFGPIEASLRFKFKDHQFTFQNLSLVLGRDAPEIRVTGNLGRLHDGPDGVLSEIDLLAQFALPSSQALAKLLPADIPEFSQISGSFNLSGTENLLEFSTLQVTATGPADLRVGEASGAAQIDMANDPEVRSLTLVAAADWPSTQSLYDFIEIEVPAVRLPDTELPELGPVRARATVKLVGTGQRGSSYALQGIDLTAGSASQPRFRAKGSLTNLVALTGLALTGNFDLDLGQLFRIGGLAPQGDLGSLQGTFAISDRDGSLGIDELDAKSDATDLLSLSLEGRFDDLRQGEGLHIAATLAVVDLAALGRSLDFDGEALRNFSYEGELSGSLENFTIQGHSVLGETRVTGNFSGSLSGARPAIRGEVSAPLVRLSDFGMAPDNQSLVEVLEAAEQRPGSQKQEWIFDDTPIAFEALRDIDLDLDVNLRSIQGVQLRIERLNGKVRLNDGLLRIDPLTFGFVGGKGDASLRADARGDRPQVELKFSADNIDLARLLSQARVQVPLDGTLDVILDLNSRGSTPRELASSLNGNTQLAIADGHVLTGLLTLTTTNPVSWVFSESARKGYSKLNCLVLRFNVADGLAQSEALLLDTPNMLAQGTGSIDLRDETLNIDITPSAKQQHLIPVSIPFSIEGRLSDPSISVNSAKASLRTSKEVLLSPLNLLGSLLPFVGDGGKEKGNSCLTLKTAAPTQ